MTALIYGATGYTGELVARHAAAAGLEAVLAGRSAAPLHALAAELGLPARVSGLDRVDLGGITAVLNTAGPFATTGPPLLAACLAAGVPYLDLAGEVPELLATRAAAAGATSLVLPGVGFGVVATDLAAAAAAALVDGATDVEIAFRTVGGVSRGTASVVLPSLHRVGVTRAGGELVPARPGSRSRTVDFGDGRPRHVVLNPWRADLVTAATSTGAATVTTYQELAAPLRLLMRGPARVLDGRAWQATLARLIRLLPAGPSAAGLASGRVEVWAGARDGRGGTAQARLGGPEAYAFTACSAVAALRRVTGGDAPAGFHTPTTAFGTGFADEIDGVTLHATAGARPPATPPRGGAPAAPPGP